MRKKSMPTNQNSPNVQQALKSLRPEEEIHTLDPMSHCVNPKCDYHFTDEDQQRIDDFGVFTCPNCGHTADYKDVQGRALGFAPGGITRSTLTLDEMGNIGEQLVMQMGELPGVGRISPASEFHLSGTSFPIDCIIESEDGRRYGVEIKTNHSEAQARFKLGGRAERMAKINYCYANGLEPALVGVRLNFFDDLADIFFRPGMTDTWIGNQHMQHVAQVNFADLNPFQSPDEKERLHGKLPDQVHEEDGWMHNLDSLIPKPPALASNKWRMANQDKDRDPSFIFVYYMNQLKIEPYHHNRNHIDMFREVLKQQHTDIPGYFNDFHSTEVSTGLVYDLENNEIEIEQIGFVQPMVDVMARTAIRKWLDGGDDDEWQPEEDRKPDFLYVSFMGQIKIEPYDHTVKYAQLFEEILKEHNTTIQSFANEFRSPDVATGEIYKDDNKYHVIAKGFVTPEADKMARRAIDEWVKEQDSQGKVETEPDLIPDYLYVSFMGRLRVEEYSPALKYALMFEDMLKEQNSDLSSMSEEFHSPDVATGELFFRNGKWRMRPRGFANENANSLAHRELVKWVKLQSTTNNNVART